MADPSMTRSIRTYILATLFATLAASALIAMIFVILCPAQVSFVVTHASRSNSNNTSAVSLHLCIFPNNTSHQRHQHTKLKLESVFVNLYNGSWDRRLGSEDDDWRLRINAHVDEMPQDYLKYQPGNTSNISVSAAAPNISRFFMEFAPNIDHSGLTVVVMAQVHFKVGIVRTRLYGIKVYCEDVLFPDQNDNHNHTCSLPPEEGNKSVPVTCHA